jgi:RimJ/RimL family protein N-acetyltransferase
MQSGGRLLLNRPHNSADLFVDGDLTQSWIDCSVYSTTFGKLQKIIYMTAIYMDLLSFSPIQEEQIRQYVSWQYEPPYDIYNENPADVDEIVDYYLDPQYQAHAITDKNGRLIGICSFGPDGRVPGGRYLHDATDIGLAIHPDLTGQGKGTDYIQSVVHFAWERYSPPALRVTIAEFNRRAQRVWQKAGFVQIERFGRRTDGTPFLVFILHNPNI